MRRGLEKRERRTKHGRKIEGLVHRKGEILFVAKNPREFTLPC